MRKGTEYQVEVRHPKSAGVGACFEPKAMHRIPDFMLRFSDTKKEHSGIIACFSSGVEQVNLRWDFSRVFDLQGFDLISPLQLSINREETCE